LTAKTHRVIIAKFDINLQFWVSFARKQNIKQTAKNFYKKIKNKFLASNISPK